MSSSEAIERQRQLVARHPQSELARYSLAKSLYDHGDFAAAIEHFQFAILRKPDWMMARMLLGRALLSLGDTSGARAEFTAARDLAIQQQHEGPLAELDEWLAELPHSGATG